MNVILLPIRKEHSDNIFKGIKKFEFRKRLPAIVDRVIVYESRGCGMAVGEFEVLEVLCMTQTDLWLQTSGGGGVSQCQFEEYFRYSKMACAIRIGRVKRYKSGIPLLEFGLNSAPQNYVWIEKS